MHNDFTLFTRTYPNGTKVVFFHAYDDDDVRVGPWTTKCRNKTAARNYCNKMMKAGLLIPSKIKPVTFGEFAEGFFDRKSEYVKTQESRGSLTDTYLDHCKSLVGNHILPFFGNSPIESITDDEIDKWLLGFKNRKREGKNGNVIKDRDGNSVGYKNSYANNSLSVINIIFTEAVRQKLITANPCATVRKLKNDCRTVDILTSDEVKKLFPKNPLPVWNNNEVYYAANRLASLTGMRPGEVMGLKGEFVFDGYIKVCGQHGFYGYKSHTKTKENRNIPLLPEMLAILRKLMKKNGNGFLFSENGGVSPVDPKSLRNEFQRALKHIGLTDEEIRARGLSPHSWRHFVNTELQVQGLTIQQVQAVTGHSSERMTKHYTHIDARQINGITEAQAAIIKNGKTVAKKESGEKPVEKKAKSVMKKETVKKTVAKKAAVKRPAKGRGSARVLQFKKKPETKKTVKRKRA
ncbi:MAG: tyrosine-type recombinase/integrase [Treponema sp.]|nr:tyrosine-type recombinase/integrase [Treponema sp.]